MARTKPIPAKWRKLFRAHLPGYDPCANAEGYWFDPVAAQKVVDFFPEALCHIEGELAHKPFRIEPWQQALLGCMFGWKRRDTNYRRYREIMVMVPRKNGKTPLAAGVCIYVLKCDKEIGAQIYSAAGEREQASLLFRHAKGMVENSEWLSDEFRIYAGISQRSIVYAKEGSSYKVLSADADTKHGGNSHLVVIDELHVQSNRDLVDVMQTSMASANRKQPLLMYITTSDYDRESICNEKYDYACKVRDGIIDDPAFLPCIYAASPDDDWTDPEVWARFNPNLDVSVSRDYLERECKRAQEQPTYENVFKRLHLNIKTEQDVRWLQMRSWDACDDEPDMARRDCYAGLDLSSTKDITALVLVFPHESGTYGILPYFWVPSDSMRERERRDRVPYETWERQGWIEATGGNVVDYDVIRERINEIGKKYRIKEVAIDRWNSTQLQTQLMGDGFDVVQFGQGFASMSAPTKELDKLVASGRIAHGGNPVLRWMASNVTVEMDAAGNLKPSKKKSTEKIDGIVALIMGLGRAIVREERRSAYADRGVLVV